MSTRQSRSASIPIPRGASSTSPSRNIESVISIPFISPSRPRLQSHTTSQPARSIAEEHRGLGSSHGVRGSTSSSFTPAIRPTARSFTHTGGVPIRGSRISSSSYEPRVIRADSSRSVDTACVPSPPSSLGRNRRASTTGGARASSAQHNASLAASQTSAAPPVSFPRPAYLEHSALRHMLQTEMPLGPSLPLPSLRKAEDSGMYAGAMSPSADDDDSSDGSPPPPQLPPTTASVTSQDGIMRLPSRWCLDMRHASLSLSADGRDLTYQGANCNGDREAAAARTNYPIPPACGIYYFEVEIRSKGQKAHISIGFAGKDVKLSRLPGWESNSWGYHGDDGCSFAAEKNGTPFGPTFGLTDVIGCGVDFTTNKAFFTKNGSFIGSVFDNVGKGISLYPSIGLQHSAESVRVNFGHEPFKFDIEYHVQQQKNNTWAKILSTPLDPTLFSGRRTRSTSDDASGGVTTEPRSTEGVSEEETKASLNKLVLSYLAHHGYAKTARSFQAQCQGSSTSASASSPLALTSAAEVSSSTDGDDVEMDFDNDPSHTYTQPTPTHLSSSSSTYPSISTSTLSPFEAEIAIRTHIVNAVIAGDIDTALSETQAHHPAVLEAEEGLMLFKLRCRKFVELILETAEMKKRMASSGERERRGSVGTVRDGRDARERDSREGVHADVDAGVEGDEDEETEEQEEFVDAIDEEGMDMEVDDEIPTSPPSPHALVNGSTHVTSNGFHSHHTSTAHPSSSRFPSRYPQTHPLSFSRPLSPLAQYESALSSAISYGQTLQTDYKTDARPEVRAIFKRTFGIVAWEDPLEAGGAAAEVVGQAARVGLAGEVNRAILKSQGKPIEPALETLYRHTAVCIHELGLKGNGSAAFADMTKEFLDG